MPTAPRRELDAELMEKASVDSLMASGLMPENGVSAEATRLFVHAMGYSLHSALENVDRQERFQAEAVDAAERIQSMNAPVHAQVHAALFFEELQRLEDADVHWRLAERRLYGYDLADYAMFKCRHSSTAEAVDVLRADDRLCLWSRWVRSVLMLEEPSTRNQAVEELRTGAMNG